MSIHFRIKHSYCWANMHIIDVWSKDKRFKFSIAMDSMQSIFGHQKKKISLCRMGCFARKLIVFKFIDVKLRKESICMSREFFQLHYFDSLSNGRGCVWEVGQRFWEKKKLFDNS